MRNIIIYLFFISSFINAQESEKNYKDEFTGDNIKRSSWEFLNNASNGFTAKFRLSNIENLYYLDLKMMIGTSSPKVFSIHEGDKLMFKLKNDEIIEINSLSSEITCTGCGSTGLIGSKAQGIKTTYALTDEQFNKLKSEPVSKIRIYTTDGYVENDVKGKHSKTIQKAFQLF
ncbi:hypothetical protein [Empedobacter sp.]|uniref:hypothetical protein n=1 Tax=Empedobacter sp. TaxID=1927715 RepID=UPI0028998AFF|nr:hypothetical protein [Empedobacter sp.]